MSELAVLLVVVLAAVYSAVALLLASALRRRAPPPASPGELPRVSVLVAARNEERDLPRCLAALAELDWPADRLEILLVDDRSTDGTRRLMEAMAAERDDVRVLSTEGLETHLRAKARPLSLAAAHATGDWLFIVDADAAVPPRWIRALLAYAADDVGLLGGPFVAAGRGALAGLERAMEAYLMAVPFGVSELGGAPIASGPNMAIRRDVYEAGGGLEAVAHDVAEDMALLRLTQRAGLRCAGRAEPDTTVRVAPVPSLRHLVMQHRRWIVGGLRDAPPFIKALVYGVGAYAWLGSALTLAPFLFDVDVTTWAAAAGARAAADVLLAMTLARRCGVRGVWPWLPLMELYLVVAFGLLVPWALLVPRVTWRGAGYEERITAARAGSRTGS